MKCKYCGEKVVEILYGMPSSEAFELVEKGELYLGGCCIVGDKEMPRYYCKKCKKELLKEEVKSDTK